MLRAAISSTKNPIDHEFEPAELLSQQMFRNAMKLVCPDYQIYKLKISSPEPTVSETLSTMSPQKRKESIHDQLVGVVSLIGKMMTPNGSQDFMCECEVHNTKLAWEPYRVSLIIDNWRHEFRFRLFRGIDFDMYKVTGDGNEGPQPAKPEVTPVS